MKDLQDPAIAQAISQYIKSIDTDRNARWVKVSHPLSAYDQFITVTIQQLGKLDSKLVVEDRHLVTHKKPSNPFGDLTDHITLSYLWVLGAYEIIRALDQRCRENPEFLPNLKDNAKQLKHDFERLRIPLAKFEPSKRHINTDSHIAYPGYNQNGIAWQISETKWISRIELSNSMLDLFEKAAEDLWKK